MRHSQYLVRRMESSWRQNRNPLCLECNFGSQLCGAFPATGFNVSLQHCNWKQKLFLFLTFYPMVEMFIKCRPGERAWLQKCWTTDQIKTIGTGNSALSNKNHRGEILTPVNIKLQGTSMKPGFHAKSQKVGT